MCNISRKIYIDLKIIDSQKKRSFKKLQEQNKKFDSYKASDVSQMYEKTQTVRFESYTLVLCQVFVHVY